jgi:ribosomal protein S18 acetylase RimI-like enzyme
MAVVYKHMEDHEHDQAVKVARSCFPLFFRPFIRKFSHAIIAVDDNQVVGGASYVPLQYGEYRIGYLEWGFVGKAYRGRRIGRNLYEKAHHAMKDSGCQSMCALVSDDNTASWRLFDRLGYRKTTVFELIRTYGIVRALLLYFRTMWAFSFGASLWLNTKDRAKIPRQPGLLHGLLFNLLLIGLYSLMHDVSPHTAVGYGAAMITYLLLTTMIPLLFVHRDVHVRMFTGGNAITTLITLTGGVMPVYLQHYPNVEQWTYHQKKDQLGVLAAIRWAVSCAIGLCCWFAVKLFGFGPAYILYLLNYSVVLGVLNLLVPIFDSFESLRVLKYKKSLFWVLAALNLFLLLITFFFL